MRTERVSRPGIYVEILIRGTVDEVWRLTQDPALHQQWDLRFTEIRYLPRPTASEPQLFLYETRIGFGLRISGTGESMGERESSQGASTSALKFASADPKSLILKGSGYWRYIPQERGVRFLTWYDYEARFGALGRMVDRLAFRPLIGWATAWSFDRLRLWIEDQQAPKVSLALALIHATARISIAFIWAWHGLVPKLMFHNIDEWIMLAQAGLPEKLLTWLGVGELLFSLIMLCMWRSRLLFAINGLVMIATLFGVALKSPGYFAAAFNPVTLNAAMIALSVIGYVASGNIPSARKCLRAAPGGPA